MIEKINKLIEEVEQFKAENIEQLEKFRIKILGSKGSLKELFQDFKTVGAETKKEVGQAINTLKVKAEEKVAFYKNHFENNLSSSSYNHIDLTLPSGNTPVGSMHPISLIRNEIADIFGRIGYVIAEGPEIEDDWHNFTALNFPPNHPARDMQDTFFIEKEIALRTHTSSVQVRIMETTPPPIRIIMPGRVYRNEAISARAHCFFHQVEGLYIAEKVSFADLKQTLLYFAKEMFGENTNIRLRPSYFPFTEPSAEMDVSCPFCKGSGCNICKGSGWVEILGCGMVDPNVLENCNINSDQYSGFAFGMGIERITMLKYQINDLRLFSENDIRFLEQFKSVLL
ncbi:MAG: phenylalanine--tRNA ligase subunit alpha [Flavobacteriales bacterium]|nr:phenylalanine--tRNA ligase subunit alpha [Flavobacteriales bacterium]